MGRSSRNWATRFINRCGQWNFHLHHWRRHTIIHHHCKWYLIIWYWLILYDLTCPWSKGLVGSTLAVETKWWLWFAVAQIVYTSYHFLRGFSTMGVEARMMVQCSSSMFISWSNKPFPRELQASQGFGRCHKSSTWSNRTGAHWSEAIGSIGLQRSQNQSTSILPPVS